MPERMREIVAEYRIFCQFGLITWLKEDLRVFTRLNTSLRRACLAAAYGEVHKLTDVL
jgi:hypothetical protein